MGMLSRFRRGKQPYAAITEEERMARYVYLLNTLPADVIEHAHATAFRDVPPERRREMFERLKPFMSESERDAAADDPTVLARLVRRAEQRRAQRAGVAEGASAGRVATAADPRDAPDFRDVIAESGIMPIVAMSFMMSTAVHSYFAVGAGSLLIGGEPAWVGGLVDPGSTGIDPSGLSGGFDGGGFEGGGFGGGFDGGGFDGGGGFG